MSTGATYLPELEQAAQEMPFDQFGRYHMMREAVDACRSHLDLASLTILDVGGFYEDNGVPTLPIKRFLPLDQVTVLDVVDCDLPGYIKGDGTGLNFPDASFDLVVSADTLEHIPQQQREQFWHELLRVARHGVILLAPFGDAQTEAAEALLFEYIRADLHAEHQQLKEHRDYRLPRLQEWLAFLEREGRYAHAYPTGYLHAWIGMMLIKHVLLRIDPGPVAQHLVDQYYNRSFFATERREPAYRQLIIVEKTAGLVDAVDTVLAPTILPRLDDTASAWDTALLPSLLTIIERQLGTFSEHQRAQWARVEQAELQVDYHRHYSEHFRLEVDHLRQDISTLERIMADQQVAINHLQRELSSAQAQLVAAGERARTQVEQYNAAVNDLTERGRWLEGQAQSLHAQLEAVQRGRVLRILNLLSGRA